MAPIYKVALVQLHPKVLLDLLSATLSNLFNS